MSKTAKYYTVRNKKLQRLKTTGAATYQSGGHKKSDPPAPKK